MVPWVLLSSASMDFVGRCSPIPHSVVPFWLHILLTSVGLLTHYPNNYLFACALDS